MPYILSEAARRRAHTEAAEFGVSRGALYVKEDDGTRWGPVACGAHRSQVYGTGGEVELVVHQTGEDEDDRFDGYQPDCGDCADQVFDTIDHIQQVRRDKMRGGQ